MDTSETPTATTTSRVFGVDFGTQRCVVAASNGDVVLNELGAMTTATLVAFKGDERLIGEAAVLSASTNPRNTVDSLNLLLGRDFAHVQAISNDLPGQHVAFEQRANDSESESSEQVLARVEYAGESTLFSLEQLTAMLFGKLAEQMRRRQPATAGAADETLHVVVAAPSAWTAREKTALALAARIAGIQRVSVVTRDAALARCFIRKHPLEELAAASTASDESNAVAFKHIAIVDIGHATTSVAIVKLTNAGETVLASESDLALGADSLDRQLFRHFQQFVRETHALDVALDSKEGKRLFQACEKLKKLLSTIGDASVTVENIAPERDVALSLTRDRFEQLCAAERTRITALVASALATATAADASLHVQSIEIVGGGTRIPFVQSAILEAFGLDLVNGSALLGRMLDSTTAIAVGAAFLGAADSASVEALTLSANDEAIAAALATREQQMQAHDVELAAIAHERNAIEAFVYEMRALSSAKHGAKIDTAALNPLLDATEDWIYSEESEFATLTVMTTKRQAIEAEIRSVCRTYFDAVAADDKAFEAHLELESQRAEAERAADGTDADDHDTRKLKKPERMRLVVKNKDEGTELFRDGNYQHAAMRYVKALSHATKFFDLSASDEADVRALKLSLYLNLAQCYLKLEAYGKAIANCKDALTIDPLNAKALYRRALAYEQEKSVELAVADVKAALRIAPDDRAILKLDERLKLVQKRQLDKEKKMWSKAFA